MSIVDWHTIVFKMKKTGSSWLAICTSMGICRAAALAKAGNGTEKYANFLTMLGIGSNFKLTVCVVPACTNSICGLTETYRANKGGILMVTLQAVLDRLARSRCLR